MGRHNGTRNVGNEGADGWGSAISRGHGANGTASGFYTETPIKFLLQVVGCPEWLTPATHHESLKIMSKDLLTNYFAKPLMKAFADNIALNLHITTDICPTSRGKVR